MQQTACCKETRAMSIFNYLVLVFCLLLLPMIARWLVVRFIALRETWNAYPHDVFTSTLAWYIQCMYVCWLYICAAQSQNTSGYWPVNDHQTNINKPSMIIFFRVFCLALMPSVLHICKMSSNSKNLFGFLSRWYSFVIVWIGWNAITAKPEKICT